MGGVVKGGIGVEKRTSPRQAAIDKVHSDLRKEYDVREERRRELEFLENGGDPLEFKIRNADSLIVQSTSVTDQQPDQLVTSEGNGSIAWTSSPHGDSVQSSGRPESHPLAEPNCADNLLLFDIENGDPDENLLLPSKKSSTSLEQSTQLDGLVNAEDLKDSMTCSLLRNSYKRRSQPNGARTSSNDVVLARGGHHLCSRHASGNVEEFVLYTENQKDQNVSMNCNSTPPSPNGYTVCKSSHDQLELDAKNEAESSADQFQCLNESVSDDNAFQVLTKDYDNGKTSVIDQRGVDIVSEDQEYPRAKCLYPSDVECEPRVATTTTEDQANRSQTDGISGSKDDEKAIIAGVYSSKVEVATNLQGSKSSSTCMNSNINDCSNNEMFTNQKKVDLIMNVEKQTLVLEVTHFKEEAAELEEEKNEAQPSDSAILSDDNDLTYRNNQGNGFINGSDEELDRNAPHLENEVKDQVAVGSLQADGDSEREKNCGYRKTCISVSNTGTEPLLKNLNDKSFIVELPEHPPSVKDIAVTVETKENNVKSVSKDDEDAILKEALIIQAKRKKKSEFNDRIFPTQTRKRSHWNYVLEEMAWLANDFAQERLWKMTAAAQLCHRVADTSWLTCQEKHSQREKKKVARLLSKAVMSFWSSIQKANKGMDLSCQKTRPFTIWEYAERFIKCNSSNIFHGQATSPATTGSVADLLTMDISQESYWTEGSLFYPAPVNAKEAYRKVIESHVVQYETNGNSLLEGETSDCDVTDFGLMENGFEEVGEETSMYDCDFGKSSKLAQKKQRIMTRYDMESYNVGADLMHTQFFENKLGIQQSVLAGKRPTSSVSESIPTKRVRTAPRQRVLSPYTAGTSGCGPFPCKTEASIADASSFQEGVHGEPRIPNNVEVESCGDFRKSLPSDSSERNMPKRKKKGSVHEQKWQVDSNICSEQRDQPRKRPESHPRESNGLFGQCVLKKPKVTRPSALDNSFDNIGPVPGPTPSPVTSQMNMSNSNKLCKILGGGDGSQKAKLSKVPTREEGSGSPWSLFEDQALVVLVHDLDPNWEFVSDALNSTLQIKDEQRIYRNPRDCKERHNILMEKTTGDGVDCTDELGLSQPYPSTMPGIPKGSARQLLQRLQGPVEEDTLKSHFQKIIMITQKQHNRKVNANHAPKQLPQPHSSHMVALSQVCPNNLCGGAVLTPLDLCDPIPDILLDGFLSSDYNDLPMTNQCLGTPMHPASGISPTLSDGRYAVSQPASLSTDEQKKIQQYNQMFPARNIQKRTLSGPGNIPGSDRGPHVLPGNCGPGMMGGGNRSLPVPGPGLQVIASSMLSSGMASIPSFVHNMHSGPVLGHGNLHMMPPSQNQETQRQNLAPELQKQVSHAGNQGVQPYGGLSSPFSNRTSSPPVSSYRPHHQQSHSVSSQQPHLLGHHPRIQASNHASNTNHQAYALQLAKERQLQHHFLQRQHQKKQHQFAASDALLPHIQPLAQFPVISPLPNNSQVQSQASSPPISFAPLSSSSRPSIIHQQKHQMSPQGLVRNSQTGGSGLKTQVGKRRRLPQQQPQPQPQSQSQSQSQAQAPPQPQPQPQPQKQQFQQVGRKHPQQRQQLQSQQQTKHVKGIGRGNTIVEESNTFGSPPNGLSTTLRKVSSERGEQAMHLAQRQSLYAGSALNSVLNSKQVVSPNPLNPTQPQRRLHPGQRAPPSKKVQQIPSYTSQGDDTPMASDRHQSVPLLVAASSSLQQPSQHPELQVQSHPKSVNQKAPTTDRVQQPSCNVDSEMTKQFVEPQNEEHHVSNTDHTHHPEIVMLEACNYTTKGAQVVPSCGDQLSASLSASELLGDPVKSILPSNLASCGTQLARVASEPTEVLLPDPIEHEVNEQRKKSPPPQKPPSPASQPHPQ